MNACTPKFHKSSRLFSLLLLLSFCFLLTSCESRKTIVNNLDEKEANEIIVFLSSKNIDATKVQSTEGGTRAGGGGEVKWNITVPSDDSIEAMAYLNQAGLPRRPSKNLLGIFTGAGLVPSEMEQKIRYQAGLAEQIAGTIRKIDGILDAEVQISFPEEDPLNPGANKQKITASVWVKHSGVLDDPNSHLITKIKRLVASSIVGLDYDNVTVIPERARFSEIPTTHEVGTLEEKQFVTVWTMIIGKESLTRFRIIFFSFTIAILLLLLALLWTGWKMYPLIKKHGGLKELFHIKPIAEAGAEAETPEEEGEAKKEKPSEGKSQADKDIDET